MASPFVKALLLDQKPSAAVLSAAAMGCAGPSKLLSSPSSSCERLEILSKSFQNP